MLYGILDGILERLQAESFSDCPFVYCIMDAVRAAAGAVKASDSAVRAGAGAVRAGLGVNA
jgi:hypothetical protein